MSRPHFRLALALIASALFHLAPLIGELLAPTAAPLPPPPPPPPLTAQLRPPPAPQPPLMLPEPPPPKGAAPKAAEPKPVNSQAKPKATRGTPSSWQEEVRKQFRQQDERGLFYPAEAIARGLEGEVLVLLILDETGHAVAARVEQGSGHPLLDNAALRAARALRSLPADAPRETLIPVRFRLH
ncbi:MAG: TonB family protein [Dechloromonas sp.]|nr:TonB family protein [Dechloromonas sp.]